MIANGLWGSLVQDESTQMQREKKGETGITRSLGRETEEVERPIKKENEGEEKEKGQWTNERECCSVSGRFLRWRAFLSR